MASEGKITHEALDYKFRKTLLHRLRGSRLRGKSTIIDEIVWDLLDDVPDGAFEERLAHSEGYLFLHHDELDAGNALDIQQELMSAHLSLRSERPITVFLTSPGGSLAAGLAVMAVIRKIQSEGRHVNVHVAGEAMSMGTIITQAANHRSIDSTGLFMVHELTDEFGGKYRENEDHQVGDKKSQDTINRIYASRSGKSAEYWAARSSAVTCT